MILVFFFKNVYHTYIYFVFEWCFFRCLRLCSLSYVLFFLYFEGFSSIVLILLLNEFIKILCKSNLSVILANVLWFKLVVIHYSLLKRKRKMKCFENIRNRVKNGFYVYNENVNWIVFMFIVVFTIGSWIDLNGNIY